MNLTEKYNDTVSIKDIPPGTKLIIAELSKVGLEDLNTYIEFIGKIATFNYSNRVDCTHQASICSKCEYNELAWFFSVEDSRNQAACYFRFKTLGGKRVTP